MSIRDSCGAGSDRVYPSTTCFRNISFNQGAAIKKVCVYQSPRSSIMISEVGLPGRFFSFSLEAKPEFAFGVLAETKVLMVAELHFHR
jgi:hypothetical protein